MLNNLDQFNYSDSFTVESGTTSVFLDLPLLETAAGLTLTAVNSEAEPFSEAFQVGFEITDETDFSFGLSPEFMPLDGIIEHSGTITFDLATADGSVPVTVGDFSIGFDPARVSEITSGFFVADTVEDNGLDILFDLSNPGVLSVEDDSLILDEADLLLSPEFADALSLPDLTGADVGNVRTDALLNEFGVLTDVIDDLLNNVREDIGQVINEISEEALELATGFLDDVTADDVVDVATDFLSDLAGDIEQFVSNLGISSTQSSELASIAENPESALTTLAESVFSIF